MPRSYDEIVEDITRDLEQKPDPLQYTYRISLEPADATLDRQKFDVFKATIYCTLNTPKVLEILSGKIDVENPVELENRSRDISQLSSWLSGARARAKGYLRSAKMTYKLPKSKLWTDLDREIELEAKCNEMITLGEHLDDLRESALKTMSLLQTLLNNIRQDSFTSRMDR